MKTRLLAILLRDGLGIIAGNRIRESLRHLAGSIKYYGIVAVFALATIVFLYLTIYEWLARAIDPETAAAILCGANLLLVALMLILRRAFRRPSRPAAGIVTARELVTASLANPAVEAGIAIGQDIRDRVRKATPGVLVTAAIVGLAIVIGPRMIARSKGRAQKRRAAERSDPRQDKVQR